MKAKKIYNKKAGIFLTLLLVGAFVLLGSTLTIKADPPAPQPGPMTDPAIKYVGNVTFELNATDPGNPSSGVAYTKYSVLFYAYHTNESSNDTWELLQNWTLYTEPIVFSGDLGGTYQVWYYSVDNCGNVETPKYDYFEIVTDRTAPVTIGTIFGNLWNPPTE